MNGGLFWRAAALQAAAVAVLFGLLLAAPLPQNFFKDYGAATGPVAWLLCALVTARVLSLPVRFGLGCAVASGALAALVGVTASHLVGLVVGVLAFGALCSLHRAQRTQPARPRAEQA